jgi:hypothetical protein
MAVRKSIFIVFVFLVAGLFIALWVNSFWETLPYDSYKTGESIEGFPFENTSMTVNGFSTFPDETFPETATDIFVNVTIQRLGDYSSQNLFAEATNKSLFGLSNQF